LSEISARIFLKGIQYNHVLRSLLPRVNTLYDFKYISLLKSSGIHFAEYFVTSIVAERGTIRRTSMKIKEGDVFKKSSDGMDFAVKRIVNDMAVLESQDRRRQILTGVSTLRLKSFYLKKESKDL
jgi:hypothetical protein